MTEYYNNYISNFLQLLETLEITGPDKNKLGSDEAYKRLCGISSQIKHNGLTQYICGNGASASFASHMAVDWSKNAKVPTKAFNDSALLTAVANDMGAEHIFSGPLDFYGKPGDLLVTISSSGNSPNIISAIHKARKLSMSVVTLSGLKDDNKSRILGDINFYISAKTYGMVECAHQVLLHIWLDMYLGVAEWDRDSYQNMSSDSYQL